MLMENLALPLLQRKVGQDHRTAIEGRGVCRLLLTKLLDLLLLRLRDLSMASPPKSQPKRGYR